MVPQGHLSGPLGTRLPSPIMMDSPGWAQGFLKVTQVILMGSQGEEPRGCRLIWGTTSSQIKIRIQVGFIEGVFSLLEQEVQPCREGKCVLERNWLSAPGEGMASFRTSGLV